MIQKRASSFQLPIYDSNFHEKCILRSADSIDTLKKIIIGTNWIFKDLANMHIWPSVPFQFTMRLLWFEVTNMKWIINIFKILQRTSRDQSFGQGQNSNMWLMRSLPIFTLVQIIASSSLFGHIILSTWMLHWNTGTCSYDGSQRCEGTFPMPCSSSLGRGYAPSLLRVQASGLPCKGCTTSFKGHYHLLATNGTTRKCTTYGTDCTFLAYRKARQ